MYKCGEKFCSNPEVKTLEDVEKCVATIMKRFKEWKGACFFKRDGGGCEECGGKVVKGGSCMHCLSCGWSPCG